MEVSGKLYCPATLLHEKSPSIFSGKEAGWAPVQFCTREKSCLYRELNSGQPARPSTYWGIPALQQFNNFIICNLNHYFMRQLIATKWQFSFLSSYVVKLFLCLLCKQVLILFSIHSVFLKSSCADITVPKYSIKSFSEVLNAVSHSPVATIRKA
jgi:hypothetical protein